MKSRRLRTQIYLLRFPPSRGKISKPLARRLAPSGASLSGSFLLISKNSKRRADTIGEPFEAVRSNSALISADLSFSGINYGWHLAAREERNVNFPSNPLDRPEAQRSWQMGGG